MMRRLLLTLVSITALLAGFYLSARYYAQPLPAPVTQQPGRADQTGVDLIGKFRPHFELASNKGGIVGPEIFSGKTVLVNFWATWCGPCREEMPMLMDLQRNHGPSGLQVVGIALDDAQSAESFVQTYGISYPILLGESDVFETSAAYGNTEGVLPYSVLIDSEGIVRWQYAGKVKLNVITELLKKHL